MQQVVNVVRSLLVAEHCHIDDKTHNYLRPAKK